MINSITFTGKGKNDYINAIHYKEVPMTKKEIAANGGRYCRYKYKDVADGYENPHLQRNLLNRTFTFDRNKINILFGPNGSGKTTILKALGAYGLCGNKGCMDGYTNNKKYQPLDVHNIFDGKDITMDNIMKSIVASAGNEAVVEWDGNPMYYHQFEARGGHGTIGELVGGIFSNIGEEVVYHMGKNSLSSGQKSFYIIDKLIKACKNCDYDIEKYKVVEKERTERDSWVQVYNLQNEYILSKHCGEKTCMTLLLDEIDKSFDILSIIALYKDFLPKLRKKLDIQIIAVTHTPFILSNLIKEKDYNIISLDEDYTKKIKESLSGISF